MNDTDCKTKKCYHKKESDCINFLDLRIFSLNRAIEKMKLEFYLERLLLQESRKELQNKQNEISRLQGRLETQINVNNELHRNVDHHFSARRIAEERAKDLQTELDLLKLEVNNNV